MVPLILHVFPSFAVGGQQTRFATIANQLGHSFRHRVISLDGQNSARSLLDPNLDIKLVPGPAHIKNLISSVLFNARRVSLINPDILVTYNWGAIEWAIANHLLCHLPNIHLEDGFGPDEADRQKWRRVLFRRHFLRRATLVVPSRNLVKIASDSWHLEPQKVVYIPNGINATRFDRISGDGAPFFHRRKDECVIGSFSPLRAEKNLSRLLRAFAAIANSSRPTRLVICGEGPERAGLSALARSLQISDKVTFTGHVAKPELVMGAFDIFAMTSDTEQMPYAVLEAMSARLPVAATDVGDIAFVVAAENRPFVVERDAPHLLVAAITQLSQHDALRRRVGDANRKRVERYFAIAPMIDAFRHLLSKISGAGLARVRLDPDIPLQPKAPAGSRPAPDEGSK